MSSRNFVVPDSESVNFVGRTEFLSRLDELVVRGRGPGELKKNVEGEANGAASTIGLSKAVLNKMIVIRGSPGVGKTELARQYAKLYHTKNPSDVVLWISAESPETIANSFLAISKQFHIPICVSVKNPTIGGGEFVETAPLNEDENDIIKAFPLTDENIANLLDKVYRYFAVEKNLRALYIFDNGNQLKADYPDPFGLEDFLPLDIMDPESESSPLVLITSSTTAMKCWEFSEPILDASGENEIGRRSIPLPSLELSNFSEAEAREYLHKSLVVQLLDVENGAQDETEKALLTKLIAQLGDDLRGFPLALNLAVLDISERYRKKQGISLSETIQLYLDEFETNAKNPDIMRSIEAANKNDQVLVTVWETWIKNEINPPSPAVIELLNLIAFLPSDCLSLEFCHFFHQDTKLTHAILRLFKIENVDPAVRQALSILEKYSIVSLQELNPQNSTDHLAFNSFIPSFEIRVHRLAKNWTNSMFSFAAHDREHHHHLQGMESHHGGPDKDFLLKFVTYIEKNYSFFNFSVFHDSLVDTITMKQIEIDSEEEDVDDGQPEHKRSKNKKNPGIYKHYTFFAISLIREAREEAFSMLQKIYQFFLHNFDSDTEEYFNLVKIALVYTHHEFISNFEYEFHQFGINKSFQFFQQLDNSGVFPETPSDPLYKIQYKDFVNLVLDFGTKAIKNQLVQKVVADILLPSTRMIATLGPMIDDSTTDEFETQNRKVKIASWVTKYHEMIQSKSPDLDVSFHSWRTAASVFQIAKTAQILNEDELTKTLLATIEAHIDHIDDFDVWEYLHETTRFWDKWVTRPFENFGEWATEDLNEASRIKKNFLDWGGLKFLIQGLVWIPQNHLEDFQHTVWHFLEIIRDLAYFEDCRLTMLNSLEFMKALSHVYSSSHEFTAKSTGENLERHIKVMVAVLLCWFAILAEPIDNDMAAPDAPPRQEQILSPADFASRFGFIIDSMRLFESEFISISLRSLGCSTELNRILKYCSGSTGIIARFMLSKTAQETSLSSMSSLASKFEEMINY